MGLAAGGFALFFLAGRVFADGVLPDRQQAEAMPVLVSLAPYAFVAERIGGDRVSVRTLLPPGADEHLFEPTPSDLMAAGRSRLWFMVGAPIEVEIAWSPKILSKFPTMQAIDTAADIPASVKQDPHVWILPRHLLSVGDRMAQALKAADPDGAAYYETRHQEFRGELSALAASLRDQLEPLRGETIMVNHPSWAHLLSEYGIHQEAVFEEGEEPGPRRMFELSRLAAEKRVRVMILSPEHATGPARLLANRAGLKVIERSALAPDYIRNLEALATAITAACAARRTEP